MKILFSHLKDFLKHSEEINVISNALFKLGHENEHNKNIIDIEFTPNKGDCLSVLGIARDLNSIKETKLDLEIYEGDIEKLDFSFKNNLTEFCPKISFLKIEVEETPKSYEAYLENYFTDLGIGKNNFFTDISNYLAYEIGQPTHCYDFNKVKNGIKLDRIDENKLFQTVTGKSIELKDNEIVFFKNEEVINFAGVMGGESTKCDSSSKSALIECAFFNPDMIIGKSVKYDLLSDAAYKFERGVDINMHDFALRRFIKIVEDHTKIKSLSIETFEYKKYESKSIELDCKKINEILGTSFSEEYIQSILKNLGFKFNDRNVQIPSWRHDVESLNDIAEEVARVFGYDNIETSSIKIQNLSLEKNINSKVNKIRNFLVKSGFSEIINDPFVSESSKHSIFLDNPLDSNRNFLRLNIINSLIKNLDYNEKRQHESIKLFEISDIYRNDKIIKSSQMLSIIISGRQENNYKKFNKKLDKEYLEKIISSLGLDASQIKELDRKLINSKIKNKIYFIESSIDEIKSEDLNPKKINNFDFNKYIPVSDFPSSTRDVSLSLSKTNVLQDAIEAAYSIKSKNLKKLFIFDFYHDTNADIIKVGFRFIFQSTKRTLKEIDIDTEMKKIFKIFKNIDGIEIPGLN